MKEETPNSKFSSLMLLADKMGHPSIKHFRYTSARTIREMMLTIGHHIGDEVAEKVRNSGVYGLLVDEVTDLSVKQQMVCFVQYIDDSGLGHVDFLDIANVLDFGSSADADTLLKSVCHTLSKNELDVRNCSSFVSDGASVMVGKENGVATKLKNIVPTLLSVHCICHRLELACTDTNKDIEYISTIERNFTQLWKYFDDSPKRTAALLKTQLQMHQIALHTGDITKQKRVYISRKMKKACKTRWLSFDNSVKSAYGDLPAVLQTLRVLKMNDDPTADGLLKRTRQFKFIGALAVLSHILTILASLSRAFQKGTINFSSVQPAIDHTMDSLDDLLPTVSDDPLTSNVSSQLKSELSEQGRLEALELQPSDFEWKQMTNLLTKYVHALKENINSRFSSSIPILQCFGIFDPLSMPLRGTLEFKTYGNESVKKMADHFYQADETRPDREENF
ncbi:unnamed protein product [Mytilus edulis]|uniref:DUF4371 domain-containing protein n=1 Tax=Mytilus edulis TaxID=6550 RepID=A0A8S3R8K9_MYTED|nr:unnamed protein product [Mytilus edulis]